MASPRTTRQAPFASALLDLGRTRSDLVVLSADLSKYTDLVPFRDTFPDRFVQVGMAEQNMMGIAGGLARAGLFPIAVTYGVFASRRAFDQVAMAHATGTAIHSMIVAFLPGITTPFRATHQATEDLALMCEIPSMTVIDPADATEQIAALNTAARHNGPVYMRGLRGNVEVLFDPASFTFEVGRSQLLAEGSDAAIISTGLGTSWAVEVVELLAASGRRCSHLHVSTLQPFDSLAVEVLARRFRVVHVIENHFSQGGLATRTAEAIARVGFQTRVNPLGIPHQWAPAGSLDYIRAELGLTTQALAQRILTAEGLA
jgi:transketolase